MNTYHIPSVRTHLLKCEHVNQTYEVRVMQPVQRTDGSERFPAIYLTDGNLGFDFAKGISHCLQGRGQVRRFMIVGIGYPGDNPFAGTILRQRDLTPEHRAEVSDWPKTLPLEGVPIFRDGDKRWGGASAFLSFVERELIPFVDDRYPTLSDERAYFGHSLGGGLGLHALFSKTAMFNRYIISSPGLSYDGDDHAIREAQDFIATGRRLDARLFMSVGEEEEFETHREKSRFVSSFFRFAALLHRAKIPGLEFTCRSYAGETHLSVYPIAFIHGVQAVFGSAEQAPLAT